MIAVPIPAITAHLSCGRPNSTSTTTAVPSHFRFLRLLHNGRPKQSALASCHVSRKLNSHWCNSRSHNKTVGSDGGPQRSPSPLRRPHEGGGTAMTAAAGGWERRWSFFLLATILVFVFLFMASTDVGLVSYIDSSNLSGRHQWNVTGGASFVEMKLPERNRSTAAALPRLAYFVSGSKGDMERLWRTLHALYHPRNLYLVHLDLEAPAEERAELARRVADAGVFRDAGNVDVITRSNMVTYRGPTMVANTLHACSLLLRRSEEWDWFINLSASDYPLVTQDDLLQAFSTVPRNTNFVDHTSRLEWKFEGRARPLMVDPGLYSSRKTDVFFLAEKRGLPSSFRLFTGSAWMVLTREFVEYCVWGYDNLPRTLLMYYANFVSSPEGYFHTVICNVPSFNTTVANHDLHFINWDNPPRQHPRSLGLNDTKAMISSNVPFARKFPKNDPALDMIDAKLLRRRNGSFPLGGWCKGRPKCTKIGKVDKLKPGPGAKRLAALMAKVAEPSVVKRNSCL